MKAPKINASRFFLLLILFLGVVLSCKRDQSPSEREKTSGQNAAISELSELIRKDPQNPELRIERASLYYHSEAYDEAIDDIFAAQKIDSLNPDYYHLLADIYLDYYKSFEALKTMEKAVRLHPGRIPSLLKLAEFKYILKMYDESIVTLNEVLAVDRLEPEAFFMLGMNFRAKGDLERAKNAFQTAVENDPELTDAWIMLGQLYENQNDPKALIFYDNALLVNPESLEALHAKAFYYQNHEEIPRALEIYRQINLIDPQYSDAYLNAGLLYLELDSLAKAHEQFNILVATDLTNPLGYFYRGFTYEQAGEGEMAKKDYEQALILAPDFEEARKALELLGQDLTE